MDKPYEIHVISNTHWDREWLYDFQETRMQLMEFFDTLLNVLEEEPGYASFLLDGQSVLLEDYVEARPERRAQVQAFIKAGRMHAGPWYTCPEEFCVGGESLVRNLLYGHRTAAAFGGVMKVGHTPFSYGQNSQMPQIYAGFGIDTILFYHGVSHEDTPNEFIFEGADGTQILGSQMSARARYNFYFGLYRPLVYGTPIEDRTYSWTRGGLPFHRASDAAAPGHHFLLDPARHFHVERLRECLEKMLEEEKAVATTHFLAFMDGHDSSIADPMALRIIEHAQPYLGRNTMAHSTLPAWIAKVKEAVHDLPVLRGERRVPKPMGGRIHLYSDVLSSRAGIKRLNARAEYALQRWAEPFAALVWSLGGAYPESLLDLAWKTLLKCHAHDSIAGSGVDPIEEDMRYRLRQVINIAEGLTRRAFEQIQVRINNADAQPDDVLVTVFNAAAQPRSEVVTAVLDLPVTSGYGPDLSLVETTTGQTTAVQIDERRPLRAVVNHAGDAPAMMNCERVRVHFPAADVPALGYTTFRLERKAVAAAKPIVTALNTLENEHLLVRIQPDGSLDVLHKATGCTFTGLHVIEDAGEAGTAWMHVEPTHDQVITSLGVPVAIALEENGPFLARYRVTYRMSIPVGIEENGGDPWKRLDGCPNAARRSSELREMLVESDITLRAGGRAIEIVTRFNNVCRNHRMRVLFPTRLATDVCHAETAFDVVERPVVYAPGDPWERTPRPTFPMQRFVDVSDGNYGLAILNQGLREYEVSGDTDRAIAVTMMRAYEVSLATVSKCWDCHPEMPLSQCPGPQECRYAIYPHAGDWSASDVLAEADRFILPLEPGQAGAHPGDLPQRHGFIEVEPAALAVSAVKRSEDSGALVLRVFNPGTAVVEGTITFDRDVRGASLISLEEKSIAELPVSGKTVHLSVASRKIMTLRIALD